MELWIRNQNRETMELTTYLQIIYLDELDQENKWVIEGGSYLGYYKTKERALEVLDEIHEYIEKIGTNELIANENGIMSGIKHFGKVYEMPKE